MSLFKRWKGKQKETVSEARAEVGTPSDTTGQRYGCHILLEDPAQDKVDIVFVHGLTGDRVSTWTSKPQKDGDRGVFWPLDLLPKSISNARIMTFGYDADVVNFWKPASQNRIFDHAKALSGALGNIRESTDTMERPIIFIGHSLGGLVIEDCLLNSNTSHEDFIRKILRSTAGIAFLGTPHGGSNQAEMAIIGANFLKLVTNPNKDIVKSLTSSSEALARIQQDFHRVINGLTDSQKIKITCFYEELPVKGIGEIVPKHSAILPAYSSYPLHANHMDMVKFSDPKDQGYIAVTNEIGRWIREELRRNRPVATSDPGSQSCVASAHKVERAAEVTSDRQEYSNSGVDQVKKQLYLSDPAHDKEEIIAYKGKHSDGTCEWILDTPEYNSWCSSPESSLFHLSGSPGKGKTVFSIFLIDHLNSRLQPNNASAETSEAILVYYFCDNKNSTRNTAVCIMRAVLFQMLQRRPELLKYIENDEKYKLIGPEIFATFLDLWRIFGGMLKDRNIPMMYIIIDGLDECDESSRALFLDHIRTLFQDPKDVSVKFIITSRNYPLICEVLTRFIKIDLDLKTERLQNDVFRFIDSEIEHLSEEKPYMDAEEVRETLKAKADDTFLWVSLVLKELRTDVTSETIKARLRTLPHGLYGIYQRLLDEIPKASHQHAKENLIWVTFAKEPLNIKGLAIALSFASDPHQSAHEFEQILKDFIRVCSSLVHEQNGIINLVHQSVKDFMLQEFGRDTPTWYRCPQGEAEKYLTKICFNYMERTPFTVLRSGQTPTQLIPSSTDDPFLAYAVKFWTAHAKQSVETVNQVFDLKSPFFNDNSTVRNLWLEAVGELTSLSPVHIACKFGIPNLLQKLIDSGGNIGSKNSQGETPLHLAAGKGELTVIKLLLGSRPKGIWDQRKLDINARGTWLGVTPLQKAIYSESVAIVKLLLEHKRINPTKADRDGMSPLHCAALLGNEEIVKLLLEKGVDPMEKDDEGRTPLHCAAQWGNQGTVELLLEKGVDPMEKDDEGRTPLHCAAQWGNEGTVKLLLEKGLDLMAKDVEGCTPLHCAVREGNGETVKLLLEKGADPMAKDSKGSTPLDCAARLRNEEIHVVKLLLEKGVDPMAKDDEGRTLLHCAAQWGNEGTVKLLLEKGLDLMAKDVEGCTPLHCAVREGNGETVKLLLEKGADPMAKDSKGSTPLDCAARLGNEEIHVVKLLLEKGVDPMAKDDEGRTLLHCAAQWGNQGTVELLLEKGFDPMAKDSKGSTPLHCAAQWRKWETVKLLLEKGVDPMAKDDEGRTPLHSAAQWRKWETVKLLPKKEVDPIAKDNQWGTLLHLASLINLHKKVVKLLLEKGADPRAKNNEGSTPLHCAAREGEEEIVILLLEKGADPMAKNNQGETPADLARSKSIKKLLRKHDRRYKKSL